MGYPTPLRGIHRALNASTTLCSVPFSRGDKLQFGNRMAVIKVRNSKKLILWSAIPLGEEFQKTLNEATNDEAGDYEIAVAIIPDKEHTLAACELKDVFPNVFLVGPSGISDKPDLVLDYEFTDSQANTLVAGGTIKEELAGFDFVFLNGHINRELVMLDKENKTLFEADLLFNIPWDGKNHDQYPHENQNKGIYGYLTCCLNADSTVGRFFHKRLLSDTPENRKGINTVVGLDFDALVMSHGSIIETGAKEAFRKAFAPYLESR